MSKRRKPKKRSKKKKVLQDHVQTGKKFRPPMLDYMLKGKQGGPRFSWVQWGLPEVLWVALVVDKHGNHQAAEIVTGTVKALLKHVTPGPGTGFSRGLLLSDFTCVKEEDRPAFFEELTEHYDALSTALASFCKFYPECPASWVIKADDLDSESASMEDLDHISTVVGDLLNRRDRPAMWVQCTFVYALFASGGIKATDASQIPDFNLMSEYPETDPSRALGASVRAHANLCLADTVDSRWSQDFWKKGRAMSQCSVEDLELAPPNPEGLLGTSKAGTSFARKVFSEVNELATEFPVSYACPVRAEVLLGLLQRMAQIAADYARNPTLTMSPWAELGARAMVEALIRMAWLAETDSSENYEWYVNYGRGQEKLYIEHLKTLLAKDRSDVDELRAEIAARTAWLNAQKYHFLQEVDVGGGTHDKNLRTLAEEAGRLDQYNLAFQSMSAGVHGHWNAIERQNLAPCTNPLHGDHRVPWEFSRPIRMEFVDQILSLYEEGYEIVAGLAERVNRSSPSVAYWRSEAEATKGWSLYASANGTDGEE